MSKTTDKYSAAELQKKYSGKSGYKQTTNKTMSNSSFWLDEDFVQPRDTSLDRTEKISENAVRLAAYQRAISNFVRIVTGRTDIPVVYSSGNDSYTNGQKVVISSRLDEKEFDSSVGLALHEGSHCALTDFAMLNDALLNGRGCEAIYDWHRINNSVPSLSRLKDLVNIIEDRRIDRFVYDSAPGYQGYYQALYKRYFNSKEIDLALAAGLKNNGASWDDYIFHICNFANPNRNLKTLPALQKVWEIVHIPTINRLKDSKAVLNIAIEVYIVIHEAILEKEKLEAAIQKQKDFTDGNMDKPAAPKPKKEEKNQEDDEELNENLDQPDFEPTTGTAEAASEEDVDDEEDGTESEASDDEDVDSDTEGTAAEGDDLSGKASDKESDSGANGSAMESEESEEEVTEEVDEEEEAKKAALLKKIEKKLEEAIKNQKEFLDGKTDKKKMKPTDAARVNAAAESNAEYTTVGGNVTLENGQVATIGKVNCLVVKGLSDSIIKSNILGSQAQLPAHVQKSIARGYSKDYVTEGLTLGVMLGKRLKTRDEERSLKTTRLDAGRIDKRLIAELGFGNDRVFAQTNFFTTRPSHIHISVDASGSMDGACWESAMKTAIAIAKAASMTSSMEVVISVRGTVGDTPLMWVMFDSRKNKIQSVKELLYAARPTGSTPEGLCFEAIQKEIEKDARGKDAYFINLSDGCPGFGARGVSYSGHTALLHTRNQVDKLRSVGIKVVSFFITEESVKSSWGRSALQSFKTMYGKDAEAIDVNSLSHLAKSLNGMFERKQS